LVGIPAVDGGAAAAAALVGRFRITAGGRAARRSSCETIGTVSDVIVVVVDSNALRSNDSAFVEDVGRLLRGIQRRLFASGDENGHGGSRPQLVFYVREGGEEEDSGYSYSGITSSQELSATTHDPETMVEDLLRLALLSGRGQGNRAGGGGHDGDAIETLEELEREVDIVVLPYTPSDGGRLPVPDSEIISSPLLATLEKDMPLSALRTLTSRIYAALLGADAAAASDGSDAEIEFDLVDITSRGNDGVWAGPFEEGEDYEDYEDAVDALSDGVQKHPDGSGLYDMNYDDDYYDDSIIHESSAGFVVVDDEEEDEEDGVAPTVTSPPQQPEDVHHDHDNTSDEEAESHGPIVPEEPPVMEEQAQDVLVELDTIARRILSDFQGEMSILEAKQDDTLLDSEKSMPILEFGRDAQNILEGAIDAFQDAAEAIVRSGEGDIDDNIFDAQVEETKMTLLRDLAGNDGLRSLFELQLLALREYYGRRYESILDEVVVDSVRGDEKDDAKDKEKREAVLTDAAQRATEGFRAAANNAVPDLCRPGQLLESLEYDIITTRELNGLMQDMVEATLSRQILEDEWDAAAMGSTGGGDAEVGGDDVDDDGNTLRERRRKGAAKWYEKVAARALVLGVNYLQGWLALQQLRKAAADRDKAMPKFPLF